MKRFIVKQLRTASGAIKSETFTVDDSDSWLFRTYVWNLNYGSKAKPRPFLQRRVSIGVNELLTHVLASPKFGEIVKFKNSDCTDLRRENLMCVAASKKATN